MAAFEDVSSPDLEQFKGGKWSDWLNAVQGTESSQSLNPDHASKRNIEVARFRRKDMTLFGYRPANDEFYLVMCEHCGRLVKPQSLSIHFERKHGSLKVPKLPSKSSSHKHGKPQVALTNHRISHSSRPSSHSSSHQKSSEATYTRGDSSSQKITSGVVAEKDRKHSDGSISKTNRSDRSSSKSVANLTRPGKPTRNAAVESTHHSSSGNKKSINKPGGTIQLEQIPESHVVKPSRSLTDANTKHHQKAHRQGSTKYSDSDGKIKLEKSELQSSTSKSRKNHDSYHHHLHNASHFDAKAEHDTRSPENLKLLSPNAERKLLSPNKDHRTSTKVPHVVMQKSTVTSPAGSTADVLHANKRARPSSGNYESSASPSQSKTPSSHNVAAVRELSKASDTPPAKVRKILPLKAREYDPNKHCGVWVKEENSHCRRSLTCKNHPLSAKRSVTGRIKPFDELVQEHGREKQRLKEKALMSKNAASPMPPPPSPSVQSLMSPPVLSPTEFAVPSPATKSTPLSPPATPTSLPSSQPQAASTSKVKPSVSLFPRIFAAWHVDCWDNYDDIDDTSTKMQNSCYTIQRQPQPLVVMNYQARRSANCQVSHCRKTERHLEALSANFEKFSTKQPKKSKPFSFTPISGRTILPGLNNNNSKQKLQKKYSNPSSRLSKPKSRDLSRSQSLQGCQYYPGQTTADVSTRTPSVAMYTQVKQPKLVSGSTLSRKLSAASASTSMPSVKQISTSEVPSKSRNRRISGQVVSLLRKNSNNDTPLLASKVPDLTSASSILLLNSLSPSASPLQSTTSTSNQNFYSGTINPTRASEGLNHLTAKTSNSAIGKIPVMQASTDLSKDRKQLVVQLPNGLKSLPGNFLLKQGSHSVTLSGNIGALTVPTDEANCMGTQIPKTMKPLNSSSNFMVQGDGNFHINNTSTTLSKLLATHHTNGPTNNQQISPINAGNAILQNDENLFLNQHISDAQNQPFSAENFAEALASFESQNDIALESGSAANELVKLSFQPENCSNNQLPNLRPIDASILEQVLTASNSQQVLPNQMAPIGARQAAANASSDLGQNYLTR